MKTQNTKLKIISICLLSLFVNITNYPLYDVQKSNVVNLNPKNFDTQITKTRSKTTVSFVHFYKPDDLKSRSIKQEIEKVANDYDGMFKIAALDCSEHFALCEKNDVREFPTFRIYPPLPAPVVPFEHEVNVKNIIWQLGFYVDSKVQEVHTGNHDAWAGEKAEIPEVLLFTDKKNVPLIYKALSLAFDKKLRFGIVRHTESALVSKYKVKAFPKIVVLPVGNQKPQQYDGETKYKPIFDFLNIYSETFFKVGEDKTKVNEPSKLDKPWLMEKFPEVNEKSGNEVCFKVDGIICVILLSDGKPGEEISNMMSELQNYLSPKIDRGLKYKFGWINAQTQTAFVSAIEVSTFPRLLIVNPGKRKRFFELDGELNMENFRNLFDKLASGDLRFKMFKGNKIPDLVE